MGPGQWLQGDRQSVSTVVVAGADAPPEPDIVWERQPTSGQSKKRTSAGGLTSCSKVSAWSMARGKPSMRNLSLLLACMAFRSSFTVTSVGTSFPSFMMDSISLPSCVPFFT